MSGRRHEYQWFGLGTEEMEESRGIERRESNRTFISMTESPPLRKVGLHVLVKQHSALGQTESPCVLHKGGMIREVEMEPWAHSHAYRFWNVDSLGRKWDLCIWRSHKSGHATDQILKPSTDRQNTTIVTKDASYS